MYMYYYLHEGLGIEEPWNDKKLFVIAAGDDTILFINKERAEAAE